MKKLKILAVLALLIMSLFTSAVSAADKGPMPVRIENVWVNNRVIYDDTIRADIERGDEFDVEVELYAEDTVDNVQVEISIDGYEHSNKRSIEESTSPFEVEIGETHYKTLTLELPEDMDHKDEYALRIEVTDKDHQKEVRNYLLIVNTPRHSMKIDDVLFSPGQTVQAGRSLLTSVRVENFGEKDEDNVKVTFTIPELGVADYDYIEEVESEDEKMTEELYIRIPLDAENKDYEARVIVDYDDGYETVEKEFTITVVGGQPATLDKTVLTVGPETQNIVAGGNEGVYPIAITNSGSESRTYTLTLTTGDWATSRLSENVLVIQPEETKVAYAYVAAGKDTTAGEKLVSLKVMSGDETLKEVTLKANVVDNSNGWDTVKKGLEIGLVVLVVLLIVIGLIIGFSRLKNKDEDDEEDEDKTYY